jgi:hypothetical protein
LIASIASTPEGLSWLWKFVAPATILGIGGLWLNWSKHRAERVK